MNATIEIDGLRKRFGSTQALDGMTFTVQPGQVTGFVGPNGAGKSTTMRVVVGLDAPDAGTATIGGRPYRSLPNPLTHVGSLLDAGALQPGRSGRNHLLWLARSQGLKAGRVDEVLALAGLESAARRNAGGYSLAVGTIVRRSAMAVAAVAGVLAIGNEYSTGMIQLSLTAVPRRLMLLSAKAAVLTGPVLIASALAVAGSALAGWLILPGRGFIPAHGYASLTAGADIRAAVGTVVYLTLIALLSFGVAAAVRDSAAAIGLTLGLLYLFPIAASFVSDATVARRLQQIGPLSAGLDVQATTGVKSLPLTPWQGLGVVALWTAGALLLGALALKFRDA